MNRFKKIVLSQKTRNVVLILIGSLVVVFANALFIVTFDIIKGGMISVVMMISNLMNPLTN